MSAAAEPGPVAERLLGFARFVRGHGFRVGLAEAEAGLEAVAACRRLDRASLRRVLRAVYCADREDWQRFDAVFDAYWRGPNRRRDSAAGGGDASEREAAPHPAPRGRGGGAERAEGDGDGVAVGEGAAHGGASAREGIGRGDFRLLTDPHALRATQRLAERLARRMRRRVARREHVQRRGRRLHLRRTVRASLRHGGTPLTLAWRRRRTRRPRLVLLLDVSRSMSLYSHLFLRFARGIVGAFSDAEAFVYHTRLVPVTDALRARDAQTMTQKLALLSAGWAGGTRIGACLHEFNRHHARRVNARTVAVILSDGLETGAPQALAAELAELRRRAGRVVWLNPLLGRPGYRPVQAGMQAALPYIDLFAPAHNLESLLALEHELVRL